MPSFFQPLNRAFFNARRRFNQIRYIHVPIYLEKRRLAHYTDAVIETLPGARPEEGKIFAIFVLFPTGDAIDESVLRALDALARHGVNILAMSNVKLGARARAQIEDKVWRIIHRGNVGFDFGAYKDGVKYLAAERPDAGRVLLMNDSVFYSSIGLDGFVRGMLGDEDVIGAFENWGEGYHIQSFALSMSGEVFRSASFQQFWKDYAPVSNRIHAIEKGEKKLSDALLRSARSSRVLYSVMKLEQLIDDDSSDTLFEDFVIPLPYRNVLKQTHDDEAARARDNGLENGKFTAREMRRQLVDVVNATSTIHSGAFLFPHYMQCPIYKKDLVYRQRFQFWEVSLQAERFMPEAERDQFMLMLRQKGDHKRLPTKLLRQYEIGVK